MERLKRAGLRFHSRSIEEGDSTVDVLQEMLRISRTEAAAIACDSGFHADCGSSLPVADSEDAAAALLDPPVSEGRAGNAAAHEHGPLAEPRLLQLPIGFTMGTYMEHKNRRSRSLRVVFTGECPKHDCAVKLNSSTSLRSFVNKHAACR